MSNTFIALFLSKKSDSSLISDLKNNQKSNIGSTKTKNNESSSLNLYDIVFIIIEAITAILIKIYAANYFLLPIENLAISIIAAFAINDPINALNYATTCSVIYAILINIAKNLSSFKKLLPNFNNSNLLVKNSLINQLLYYLSYHIIFNQFIKKILFNKKIPSDLQIQSNQKESNSLKTPFFSTNIVKDIKSCQPEINNSNIKTTILTNNDSNNNNNITNQLYQLEIDLSQLDDESLKSKYFNGISKTTNLENFIKLLFNFRTHFIIAPFWSIFITIKTTIFEKLYLNSEELDLLNNSNNSYYDILPVLSNELQRRTSLFDKNDSTTNSMTLITETTSDDFDQLNLVSKNQNIFNKKQSDYKVCIIDIGTHSISFHIENLNDGELIVLVNGLIWSEVSCTLIMESVGEEYVVVSGLVPSCSYDIQFVNRLNQIDDYLIADLIIRTNSNNNKTQIIKNGNNKNQDQLDEDILENFENLDFSFPSYYHRKFLSPLLTLKHSVLTTNTNLSDERSKMKKMKKEINKKLNSLRQEIDHFRTKLKQNATIEEKNSFKVDNLKITLQQNENSLNKLEENLKKKNIEENDLEDIYLNKKNDHLKKELEFSKIEESLKTKSHDKLQILQKTRIEFNQLTTKFDKLNVRHDRLQKELDQNTEIFENFKTTLINKCEKSRLKRKEFKMREINELELTLKGLEQDLNRTVLENDNMLAMINKY